MSRSDVESRTKSVTSTSDTVSTIQPLATDRWSHNITYRQLVVSSCIGIVQLWWHPYVHDLTRMIPFLFLYNVFSLVVGFPLFYMELALGVVTKKGVLNCWDLAPISRGVGLSMLLTSVFTALSLSCVSAWSLALLVHSFHSFLPWLHCAAAADPPCAARHRPLTDESETPAQSFFFNFILNLKRENLRNGMGTVVWELALYYIFCWFLIYLVTFKRIYSYSKLVMFKDVLAYFVVLICIMGSLQLNGSTAMFKQCNWSVLLTDIKLWQDAMEFTLIEMTVSQGSLIMLGAHCPKRQHALGRTSLMAFTASKTTCMGAGFLLGATHGALKTDYHNQSNIWGGGSASIVLWSDLVARIPGSQFWSAIVFFSLFVLAISSTALLVQTIMSTLTGRSIYKISWAFLILTCILFAFIGTITVCTQGGLYVQNFLMTWPAQKSRVLVAAMFSMVVSYVYGQSSFCEDVYFAVGEYPCLYIRVCWAFIPVLLVLFFILNVVTNGPIADTLVGWILVNLTILPILVIMLFYLVFKFRVRNIVRPEK